MNYVLLQKSQIQVDCRDLAKTMHAEILHVALDAHRGNRVPLALSPS